MVVLGVAVLLTVVNGLLLMEVSTSVSEEATGNPSLPTHVPDGSVPPIRRMRATRGQLAVTPRREAIDAREQAISRAHTGQKSVGSQTLRRRDRAASVRPANSA
jgi:hypothetical protein